MGPIDRSDWWLRRAVVLPVLLGLAAISAMASMDIRDAEAWPAGGSASNTMVAWNWDTWQSTGFPYFVDSNIAFTKIWQGGIGYTQIDHLVHQTKTYSNWSSWQGYLFGSYTTTFYSDSYYLFSFSNTMNGWCTGPQWTFWDCDSGSLQITVLGYGTAVFQGTLVTGGGQWGTVSGSSASGSYNWWY